MNECNAMIRACPVERLSLKGTCLRLPIHVALSLTTWSNLMGPCMFNAFGCDAGQPASLMLGSIIINMLVGPRAIAIMHGKTDLGSCNSCDKSC